MPAQPVDVCRDCPLDTVLGEISHVFSDTGVVHVAAGPVLWAASRLQLDLYTRNYFFNTESLCPESLCQTKLTNFHVLPFAQLIFDRTILVRGLVHVSRLRQA